jgi:hypothetical protein
VPAGTIPAETCAEHLPDQSPERYRYTYLWIPLDGLMYYVKCVRILLCCAVSCGPKQRKTLRCADPCPRIPVKCLKEFVVLKENYESEPSKFTQAVRLLTFIREVLSLYLGRATDYLDWELSLSSSECPRECRYGSSDYAIPASFHIISNSSFFSLPSIGRCIVWVTYSAVK